MPVKVVALVYEGCCSNPFVVGVLSKDIVKVHSHEPDVVLFSR